MFFSPDLLSKRDSGFGLLWLAATLGSKSAFKKLPKRSVMTADISQLCQLIATPTEPLALRLSSNLLVGAARVYRVKQEIFISDVTACFNTLKRVERELRSMTSSDGQLQMAQPSVKPSAVTLRADPKAAFSMDFDAMVMNWDEYLNPEDDKAAEDEFDDEYYPTIKTNRKAKASSSLPADSEILRATACTLPDNHDLLFANSFDASFGGSGADKVSSSQIGGFGFDDTFDGLDIEEGLGDDLVRELGEGWGGNPIGETAAEDFMQAQEPFDLNLDGGDLDIVMTRLDEFAPVTQDPQLDTLTNLIEDPRKESAEPPLSSSLVGTSKSGDLQSSAQASCSPSAEPAVQSTHVGQLQPEERMAAPRKPKRTRPILDVRTELTDEELKATRMYYLDKQNAIRYELEIKKFEKRQVDLIHTLLWGAPGSMHAKELADFWVKHFKAHVEARSGFIGELECPGDEFPPSKRRKVSVRPPEAQTENMNAEIMLPTETQCADQEAVEPINDFNYHTDVNWGDIDEYTTPNPVILRSSEEPGQARHASHPPSVVGGNLGVDVASDNLHSQRSALFPWDMAGGSSSISIQRGGVQHDRISIEHADTRLRGSSASRRGSSLPSVPGNLQTSVGSPAVILPVVQSDDDFVFDVPGDIHVPEARQSEVDRTALEKNSHNFLEYAKMQYRSLPNAQYLVFDDVVPKTTSTARVAAAALYHCLVLATKDLLNMKQEEPYGRIDIRIV